MVAYLVRYFCRHSLQEGTNGAISQSRQVLTVRGFCTMSVKTKKEKKKRKREKKRKKKRKDEEKGIVFLFMTFHESENSL